MRAPKESVRVAVIGGSGLYDMPAVSNRRELKIKTPFGEPSGPILLGELAGVDCAFLPRHGRGHILLPGELPQRANIWALKSIGVEKVLAVGAVGSLKEELAPEHFVFPDQIVDRTKGRVSTFFGRGVVAHVAFDAPFCEPQQRLLYETARTLGVTSHWGGTYCCMEGPAFSTRAESEYHRRQGYSVIGMTAIPEAKLAREAELCYSLVALVTDYDCWKQGEEVSSEKVLAHLQANVAAVQRLLEAAIPAAARRRRDCRCGSALDGALFTNPRAMNPATVRQLELLIGRQLRRFKEKAR